MPNRKLTVTHEGQTFTRTTQRTYTHVVLVKSDYAYAYATGTKGAADCARINYPYYVREANPATRAHNQDAKSIAAYTEIAALTIDEYAKRVSDVIAAKVDAMKAAGDFDRFGVFGWSGRLDLAQKEAERAKKHGYKEVVIVPVPV